jgi:membrane protein required for colicin V production
MIIDIPIAIIIIWGAYKGFTKGFIVQMATLIAIIIGIWGAVKFSGFTTEVLFKNTESNYIPIISFAVTFIIIIIAIHLLARLLDKLIKSIDLNIFNRILGIAFGILKNAFIVSIILLVMNRIDENISFLPEEEKEKSLLYVPLSNFAPTVLPYLHLDKLKKRIEKEKESDIEKPLEDEQEKDI